MIYSDISRKLLRALPLCAALLLSSCFKAEAPNAECDVEQAWVQVDNWQEYFFKEGDMSQTVRSDQAEIKFEVKHEKVDLTKMAPQFKLTPGATITPASGTVQDFSNNKVVKYTVTSQDGNWHKDYLVSFTYTSTIAEFHFEETSTHDGIYTIWTGDDEQWSSGNPGYKMSRPSGEKDPSVYPSVPCEGKAGKGVKLETRETGAFGKMVKRPLAAGNIFLGKFDTKYALSETLKCTQFGIQFDKRPLELHGWYKYKPGKQMTDENGKEISGVDHGTIYAVFYDNNGGKFTLDGTNVLAHENIVAVSEWMIGETPDEWQPFTQVIQMKEGKTIDPVKLKNRGYSLTIVASSSIKGDRYEGAVGSTLYVDEFYLTCE